MQQAGLIEDLEVTACVCRGTIRAVQAGRIEVVQGDITTLDVEAIVNAANSSLLGGSGVDGAIHRAAGPELAIECRMLGGCKTGQAKLTSAYRLRCDWIIHTVGPVWQGGDHGEAELLAQCYESCLALAAEKQIRSLAFPAISCGIYGFPLDAACAIATQTVERVLREQHLPARVVFCAFTAEVRDALARALAARRP